MGRLSKFAKRLGFRKQFQAFADLNQQQRPELSVKWPDCWPRLDDNTGHLPFDAHYVYHTAWAARVVARLQPTKHVDISSYTYFATIVSAFIPVDFYDYRPADIKLSGMHSGEADLCNLPFADASIPSLSCMHTIEHIGLGRYGDPLDPLGDRRALKELQRVLAADGSLIIVVPVGSPRIQFNAHRIYSLEMLTAELDALKLVDWSVLGDDYAAGLIHQPDSQFIRQQKYGCGCFLFQRP